MASKAIFTVPFAYKATVVRNRCRNAERITLRDAMPVEILELSQAEAPVRLKAELRHGRELRDRIELRHDGRSYLRPVVISSAYGSRKEKRYKREYFESMLNEFRFPPPAEIDTPKSWLTSHNVRQHKVEDGGWKSFGDPAEIETTEQYAPKVREWLSTEIAEGQRAVVAEAEDYVLVGDDLYRRTGAPMLAWAADRHWTPDIGEPGATKLRGRPADLILADRAEFEAYLAEENGPGAWWQWWPIAAFERFMALEPGTEFRLTVEAPLQKDPALDAVEVGRTVIPRVDHYLVDAARQLSDSGLDAYRTYRHKREAGLAGDPQAMLEAMEAVRALGRDRGFEEGNDAVRVLTGLIAQEMPHWDALTVATGLALDRRDEDVMAALAP